MHRYPIHPKGWLRTVASLFLVFALAACGASAPAEGDGEGDPNPPTDFR